MKLTNLEVKTLKKLASGLVIKQIADNENCTHSAIDKRIKTIKGKLKAKTLAQCIYRASKAGVICLLLATTSAVELEMAINPDFTDLDLQRRVSRRIKTSTKKETSSL
ncbi:signal transduction response regulator, C-terminal effector [Vibrio phage 1.231.O._10N.261.49.F8]|nr:signal transduction response regulator, C-terminal effector [Vibrio phage 1.119.O._10N.261.51.A9]AUR89636.1 signal transduction response regulator, C-terminal effector [Vibrio phage 1.127.O._10N.286.52.E12]AUR90414.1 signal transduction response regulator, C-terminal effector [Vibrio phage 1.143.O._10N.261.55.C8]AUR96700.1 signal transduction response regulator, C-terminal effector [Vibrio phage 1.231.O._10N.261.49.F8]